MGHASVSKTDGLFKDNIEQDKSLQNALKEILKILFSSKQAKDKT